MLWNSWSRSAMGREKKAVLKWWRNPHLLHFKDLQRPCLLFQGGSHEKDDHRRTKDTQQHQTHKDLMREHCDRGKRRAWPRKHKKSCQKKNSEIFGCSAVPSKWLGLDDKGTNETKTVCTTKYRRD